MRETKYPLKKMLKLAFDGITAFSNKPLVIAGYLGAILFSIGLASFIGVIVRDIINHMNIVSLGLILTVNLMMFGLTFCFFGIVGQYIGRIFDEVRERPLFIVDRNEDYRSTEVKEHQN